jgi:hypothetical protein
MDKYAQECADYIYESEFEDFINWLSSDAEDVLDPDVVARLEKYCGGNEAKTEQVGKDFVAAAKYHIYASAWLCVIK